MLVCSCVSFVASKVCFLSSSASTRSSDSDAAFMSPSLLRFDREEERSAKRREEIRQRAEERWDLDSHLSLHRLEMSATHQTGVYFNNTGASFSAFNSKPIFAVSFLSGSNTARYLQNIYTRSYRNMFRGHCLFPSPCCSVFLSHHIAASAVFSKLLPSGGSNYLILCRICWLARF